MKNMKKKFNIFNFILKIGYDLLMAFCIILILIILMQKITSNEKSILGYRIFTVISGSMEPKYSIGEVVICKDIKKTDIKIGDTIVYKGITGQVNGKIIMHDVVDITYDENENMIFHARGLENNQDDPDIKPSQIYGVCIFESYLLTLLYDIATSTYASAIIVIVLVLNVFLSFKLKNHNHRELNAPQEDFVDLSELENKENISSQEESVMENKVDENEGNDVQLSAEKVKLVYAKVESLKIKASREKENRKKIEEEIKLRLKKK